MVPTLVEQNKCIGCGVCALVCTSRCISLEENAEGFRYPVINDKDCIHCRKCENSCPILSPQTRPKECTNAYASYSLHTEIRDRSSSGGIFSEIAAKVLQAKGIVFGAAYDESFSVHHCYIDDITELPKLCGAKYALSELGDSYKKVQKFLQQNFLVLFSGTPCQTAGLKAFLRKDYSNLITVDFVCHGIPSPKVWEKYVEYRAEQDNHGILPEKINLRSKCTGWSQYRYSNEYRYNDDTIRITPNEKDIFMRLFVGGYINRQSCTDCHFKGYQRGSDITLGDFWGVWDIAPDMDDDRGTSVVLVHSEKGRKIFQDISHQVIQKQITLEQSSAQNPSMVQSQAAPMKREEIMRFCLNGDFKKVEQELFAQKKKTSFVFAGKRAVRRLVNAVRSLKK